MFDRTRRGIEIAVASLKVLARHPKLAVFPIISAIAMAGTGALVAALIAGGVHGQLGWPYFVVVGIAGYFGLTFVAIFFNAALVFCVLDAFAGRPVLLMSGLFGALTRSRKILAWVLFAGTVGLAIAVLKDILRKFGFLGALLGSGVSMSWAILTAFIVPVLVAENLGPRQALHRSTEIVKQHWASVMGVGAFYVLMFFVSLVPPIVLLAYVNSGSAQLTGPNERGLAFAGIAIACYAFALFGLFGAIGTIFRTGIYEYAATGRMPLDVQPST
jgi:MFS family permease